MAKHLFSNNADDYADDDEELMDLMPAAFTLLRQDLEGVMHPNLARHHFTPAWQNEQSHKRKSGDFGNRNIGKENKENTNAYDRKKKKRQSRGSGRFVKPLHFQVSNKVLNSNKKNKPGKPMSVEHFWINEEKKDYAEKFIRRLSSDIGSQICTQESTTLGGKRRGGRKVLEKVNVEFTDIDTETLIEEEEPSLISQSDSGKGIFFENQTLKFQEEACRNPIQSSESNLRLRIAEVLNTASLPLHGAEVLALGCPSKSYVLCDNGSDMEVSENDSPMAPDQAKGSQDSAAGTLEASNSYISTEKIVTSVDKVPECPRVDGGNTNANDGIKRMSDNALQGIDMDSIVHNSQAPEVNDATKAASDIQVNQQECPRVDGDKNSNDGIKRLSDNALQGIGMDFIVHNSQAPEVDDAPSGIRNKSRKAASDIEANQEEDIRIEMLSGNGFGGAMEEEDVQIGPVNNGSQVPKQLLEVVEIEPISKNKSRKSRTGSRVHILVSADGRKTGYFSRDKISRRAAEVGQRRLLFAAVSPGATPTNGSRSHNEKEQLQTAISEVSYPDSKVTRVEITGLESQTVAESSQPSASKDILIPPKERENNAEELKILKHRKRGRQREVEEDPGLQGAGMTWENGTRRSTRMKYKPLDYWRGERLIYGRIHKSVCTLVAVKYTSPVNVWAETRRGYCKKFKIDSLVSDEYQAMLDILA